MIRRALSALALTALAVGLLAAPAQASTPRPAGNFLSTANDTFAHRVTLQGWAFDRSRTSASVPVWFWIDGHYAGHTTAKQVSTYANHKYRISGKHNFTFSVAWSKAAKRITIKSPGANASAKLVTLATRAIRQVHPGPGERIVAIAKRYVGKARYVEGGTTPKGFDCSGYTKYVYAQAKVKTLPRTAEQQRHAKGMKLISASKARPGDLVFYLSGGSAYHVAIYAGHGWQYAAATAKDGVRYQAVWSRSVQYGTDWH